jgi:adenine deaminase
MNIDLIKVARKIEKAALVLKNGRIVNVFSGLIETKDIAVEDGLVVGIGEYEGYEEMDLMGKYVAPGFIDGHVHIESSMLTPPEFAKIIMPKGTTSIIADPHEIANVNGVEGIRFLMDAAKATPLDVFMMIPSCVPATIFETSGDVITANDIGKMKLLDNVSGLGEVMNYPDVLSGDPTIHEKISIMQNRNVDGHAPGLTGPDLNAYILSGIKTDHECTTYQELEERVARGMYVLLREGSHTRNEKALLQGYTLDNHRRLVFCTDDKHPEDIVREGHINYNVNLAIKNGISPIMAIRMATINTAECYKLKGYGGIAPGYFADMIVFDNLNQIEPEMVFKKGQIVANNGKALFDTKIMLNGFVTKTVKIKNSIINLNISLNHNLVNVIDLIPNNATTKKSIAKVKVEQGLYVNNPNDDILKLAVIERHHYSGNVGLGLVRGYGLTNGAIAMTISHDSHNLIVLGDNDSDMQLAIETIKKIDGGIVIVRHHEVIEYLSLEVGGIMTNAKAEIVIRKLNDMVSVTRKMGVKTIHEDPFLSLAFLSLMVIPEIKLSDKGLFDVTKFAFIPLEVEEGLI